MSAVQGADGAGDGAVLLAIDSGSQSSRALVFDRAGEVLGRGQAAHQPMRHPESDAVEQDPHDILACTVASIRACLDDWGGDPAKIAGAAVTTQRNTVLPLDTQGQPLADAISWLDRRRAGPEAVHSRPLRALLRILGEESLLPRLISKSGPLLWRERGLTERLACVANIEGWLHRSLIGEVVVAPGGVVGPWPFDAGTRSWSRIGLLHRVLGFEAGWLPRIVEAGSLAGRLGASAAERTGLPEGLPFYAVGGDKQAEVLGAGVRAGQRGTAEVSLGTGCSVSVPWHVARQSLRYDWITTASAEPASWNLEYMVFRGMWTARWFVENLARDLSPVARERGCAVEALLSEEASQVPMGCDGLVCVPRWSPSLQHSLEAGAWQGLREIHSRAHLYRALLEGIVFDLHRGAAILEGATGEPLRELRVGGGGARSPLMVQILADVFGLPVVRAADLELAARGAAIVAAVGAGVHASYTDAVAAMVHPAETVTPDRQATARYRDIMRRRWRPALRTTRAWA